MDMEGAYYQSPWKKPDLSGLENDTIIPIRQCSCSYCESNIQINNLLGHRSRFSEYDNFVPVLMTSLVLRTTRNSFAATESLDILSASEPGMCLILQMLRSVSGTGR